MTENMEIEQVQAFLDKFGTLNVAVYSYTIDILGVQSFSITDKIEKILGCSKIEFNTNVWKKAIYSEDRVKVTRWKKQIQSKLDSGIIQYRIIHPGGSVRWIEEHLTTKIGSDEQPNVFLGIIFDITARKEHERQLEYMAFYDTLTGLPNRNLLIGYFPKAIARCKRKNTQLAIMYLDLDKFKNVNDSFGHDVGDLLLKQVAQRLMECVRDGDIVSRQGGDEFIILLEDIYSKELHEIAKRILTKISAPFIIDMKKVNISASIGISLYPEHGEDLEILTRHADEAMFECKASSNYQFYESKV